MAILLYRLALGLLSPLALVVLLLEGRKRQGGWRFLRERCGFQSKPSQHCDIWFHAASVGEANAIFPLLRLAVECGRVLVTTNTPEAARLVAQRLGDQVSHCYCPLDFAWATRRLIANFQPKHLFIAETELWPNLFHVCEQRDLPVVIINGRLSHKTRDAHPFVKRYYRAALQTVSAVWARSQDDAEGFIELGCAKDRIKVLGNIKFAGVVPSKLPSKETYLPERQFVLAASTHADEEIQLATIWQKMENAPLLVIVPRHPPRGPGIADQLRNRGHVVSLRSAGEVVDDATQIYVADTLGELNLFAQRALWVFMGGSLVPIGGHNMLEPASLGKAVVSGWHLNNFREESDYLLARQALWVAKDVEQLAQMFTVLLADHEQRTLLEKRAAAAMQEAASVLTAYETEFAGTFGGG